MANHGQTSTEVGTHSFLTWDEDSVPFPEYAFVVSLNGVRLRSEQVYATEAEAQEAGKNFLVSL